MTQAAFLPLFRFHLQSGIRIGLRWLIPTTIVLFVVPVFLADPGDERSPIPGLFRSIARALFADSPVRAR